MKTKSCIVFAVVMLIITLDGSLYSQGSKTMNLHLIKTIDGVSMNWLSSQNGIAIQLEDFSLCVLNNLDLPCSILLIDDPYQQFEVSPDDKLLALSLEGTIKIIDLETHSEIETIDILGDDKQGVNRLTVAWSSRGDLLAVQLYDTIHVYNSVNWNEELTLKTPNKVGYVTSLAWSPDDTYLAIEHSPTTLATLVVLDIASGATVYTTHSRGFAWLDQNTLAVLQGDSILKVSSRTFQVLQVYEAWNARSMAWSPNSQYMVYYVIENDYLVIVNGNNGQIVSLIQGYSEQQHIKDMAWSPDGRYLAILANHEISIFEVSAYLP